MKQRTRRDCHCCRNYCAPLWKLSEPLTGELIRARHKNADYIWGEPEVHESGHGHWVLICTDCRDALAAV